jgi:hypothetical protein
MVRLGRIEGALSASILGFMPRIQISNSSVLESRRDPRPEDDIEGQAPDDKRLVVGGSVLAAAACRALVPVMRMVMIVRVLPPQQPPSWLAVRMCVVMVVAVIARGASTAVVMVMLVGVDERRAASARWRRTLRAGPSCLDAQRHDPAPGARRRRQVVAAQASLAVIDEQRRRALHAVVLHRPGTPGRPAVDGDGDPMCSVLRKWLELRAHVGGFSNTSRVPTIATSSLLKARAMPGLRQQWRSELQSIWKATTTTTCP